MYNILRARQDVYTFFRRISTCTDIERRGMRVAEIIRAGLEKHVRLLKERQVFDHRATEVVPR